MRTIHQDVSCYRGGVHKELKTTPVERFTRLRDEALAAAAKYDEKGPALLADCARRDAALWQKKLDRELAKETPLELS